MLLRKWIAVFTVCVLCLAALSSISGGITQAQNVSATPGQINLPQMTDAPDVDQFAATETPTRTPTPEGLVLLEAITEANVRAEPDQESERLGLIRAGETYVVRGRYFRWLQFEYATSSTGVGWVYDELVTVIGDVAAIQDLSVTQQPTLDSVLLNATETMEVLTLTPGGIFTATSEAVLIPAPVGDLENTGGVALAGEAPSILPTFTYPPNIVAIAPTQNPAGAIIATPENGQVISDISEIPPILPILLLGGFGLLGIAISAMRR